MPEKFQLLWTWMIPHSDDDGRLYGDPKFIKGIVVPLKNWSLRAIEEALLVMDLQELVYYYEIDGIRYIQIIKFNEHQYIQKDRYQKSKLPKYDKLNPECIQVVSTLDTKRLLNINKYNISKYNTISKEIGGKKPQDSSKEIINILIKAFKEKTGLVELGESTVKTRQWGWNLTRKYTEIQINEAIDWLLEDDFWKDNLTKLSQLWYQMPRFLRETDTTTEEVK